MACFHIHCIAGTDQPVYVIPKYLFNTLITLNNRRMICACNIYMVAIISMFILILFDSNLITLWVAARDKLYVGEELHAVKCSRG